MVRGRPSTRSPAGQPHCTHRGRPACRASSSRSFSPKPPERARAHSAPGKEGRVQSGHALGEKRGRRVSGTSKIRLPGSCRGTGARGAGRLGGCGCGRGRGPRARARSLAIRMSQGPDDGRSSPQTASGRPGLGRRERRQGVRRAGQWRAARVLGPRTRRPSSVHAPVLWPRAPHVSLALAPAARASSTRPSFFHAPVLCPRASACPLSPRSPRVLGARAHRSSTCQSSVLAPAPGPWSLVQARARGAAPAAFQSPTRPPVAQTGTASGRTTLPGQ